MVYYLRKQLAVRKCGMAKRLLADEFAGRRFHRAKAHEREDAKRIRACTAKKRRKCRMAKRLLADEFAGRRFHRAKAREREDAKRIRACTAK